MLKLAAWGAVLHEDRVPPKRPWAALPRNIGHAGPRASWQQSLVPNASPSPVDCPGNCIVPVTFMWKFTKLFCFLSSPAFLFSFPYLLPQFIVKSLLAIPWTGTEFS